MFGGFIGYLLAAQLQLKSLLRSVQEELSTIRSNLVESRVTPEQTTVDESEAPTLVKQSLDAESVSDSEAPTLVGENISADQDFDSEAPTLVGESIDIEDDSEAPTLINQAEKSQPNAPGDADDEARRSIAAARSVSLPDRLLDFLREFFTTGNVVVKIGVIILFFGVGFLIRYAVERQVLPIELRLVGIAIGAIIMLIVGWRLRHARRGYALILQGGAVGILYITIFASAKNFHLLDPLMAFLLMIALVSFSAILAYKQDSRNLAVFGSIGGFVAPILTSTGSGSHVMLFSYYALLNTGIFAMAWLKSWRLLNWVGFVFTFVIGAAWGWNYYEPEYFASTEPFLILFFLFYLAIAVLFTHRQPPQLKGLVDGTLVFGVPLVGFTLQAGLVADFEFGRAYSALGMAAIYIGLARLLWHKQLQGMRVLTESFLALGVIFASLAVPFALDGRWTAATWSLEGAAAVWLGIRQGRVLTRSFGLLLQIGASLMFLATLNEPLGSTPVLNSAYIGCLFTSLAGLFTSYRYYQQREELEDWEQANHIVLLVWGLLWWFGAGFMEIEHHLPFLYVANTSLLFFAGSFIVFDRIARRLQWQNALMAAVALLPGIIFFLLLAFLDHGHRHPFAYLGFLAWPLALAAQYRLLYLNESLWQRDIVSNSHILALWTLTFVSSWVVVDSVNHLVTGSRIWGDVSWGLVPALFCQGLIYWRQSSRWPLASHRDSYLGTGITTLLLLLSIWLLASCFIEARPRPLDYVPIVNPLELVQLLVLLVLMNWYVQSRRGEVPAFHSLELTTPGVFIAILAFAWLNSVIARSVHFIAGVRFDFHALYYSSQYQSSVSIAWTLTALLITTLASRQEKRKLWFTGAILIVAVTIKLFVIDLKDTGTIERIISFLTVGVLLSVIGYLSPVPPKATIEQESNEEND